MYGPHGPHIVLRVLSFIGTHLYVICMYTYDMSPQAMCIARKLHICEKGGSKKP